MKSKPKNKFQWHELIDKKFVAVYIALALVLVISQVMFAIRSSKAAGPYHVSVADGNDVNCTGLGTAAYVPGGGSGQSCPWQTVAKVNSIAFVAGDQILFKRGETFNGTLLTPRSGDPGNPIVYADYDVGDKPIIVKSGTYTYAVSIRDGRANITLRNLQFQDGTNQNIMLYNGGATTVSGILIEGVVSRGDFHGINALGGNFIDITIKDITFDGIGVTHNGVYIVGNNLTNIDIDNVTVSGCLNGIVAVPNGVGTDVSITNSSVSNCSNDAVTVTKTTTVNLSDLNLINNAGRGILLGGVIDTQINRVTATGNSRGIYIGSNASSYNIDISDCDFSSSTNGNGFSLDGIGANNDVTVTNVRSSNNWDGDGFNVHGNWTNVIFDHCEAEENGADGEGADGDGFSFHDTTTGIIRYSISKNNLKSAIAHINQAQVDMYYNLFYHDTNGKIALVTLADGIAPNDGIYNVYNNVIYSGGNTGVMLSSGGGPQVITAKNNIIKGGNIGIRRSGSAILTEDYNIINSVINYSSVTPGANSILSDPQFVFATPYDFHLQSISPAIDAGIDLGLGYALDFEGLRTPVGDFDMGAYEYPLGIFRSSLNQYKADGITQILSGAWTVENTVVFKFQMDSRDDPETFTPQIELRPMSGSFIDTATHTEVPFSGSSPAWASVTASGLTSGESYHWQARFINPTIDGAWMPMGGSPDFKVDFVDPSFTEVEGVDAGPIPTDTINYLVADASSGVNVLDLTVKYGFSTDAVCDVTDIYGNPFTSGVDFIITGLHFHDYLCLTAADNAGNIAYHNAGQLNTTLPDTTAPTFTVNDGVSLTQTTSDTINVTVNDPNLDPTTVKYAFSADNICDAGDTYSTLFTSGITFTILPTHHDYLCLVASDLYGWTDYYSMGRLNVVPEIILGGAIELAGPIDVVPPCVAIDVQENNAVVKAIDWKFIDNSYDEIGFRLYDPLNPSRYVEVANANINQIQLTGLQTNKAYTRVVVAYKVAITSSATSPATCYTLANVPKKMTISQKTADSITLIMDPNDGNPSGTKYAIKELKSNQYINGNGIFTAVPVWLTYEQWGAENGITVWGTRPTGIIAQIIMALTSGTEYDFALMAENGDGIATGLSESTSGSTSGSAPVNTNINQPPVVPPTNTNQPPVVPPPSSGEVPTVPTPSNENINQPVVPEPSANENINEAPIIAPAMNENINQPIISPESTEPQIPILGAIVEIFNNPDVEQVSQSLITPLLVTVAAVNTIPAVIILTLYLLPYLHLIFLEPLLLLFRKKRQKWGIVYNSLTKLPVDLALVRLYNKKTNQLVQTKVTDREGRYIIIAKDPGKYYISVVKPGFISPSSYLKGEKQDTKYIDLYHGELIEVTEKDAVLTANIPLDPAEKKALAFAEIIRSYLLKNLRLIVSYVGLILALVIVLIIPTAITVGALIIHVILFLFFRRFLVPAKPKSWGIVYDAKTKEPLGASVIRIFDLKFNKLLETQVTDSKGRYSFLVGKNEYQLLAERPGYQNKEIKPVDLVKNEDVINLDVGLNKI